MPRAVTVFLLCLAGGLLAAGSPRGQTPTDAARERDLAEIRRQIVLLEGELRAARGRERSLAGELQTTEVELALQERRVAETQVARDAAAERIETTEARVAHLGAELAAAREALRTRLAGLYRLGRHGTLRLALVAEPGEDLAGAIRLVRYLARRDAGAVDAYTLARERLAAEVVRLAAHRREVERWLAEAEARRGTLRAVLARREALLARARAERQRLAAATEGLLAKERKLSDLVDLLYGRETARSGRSIAEFRGVLDWPVEGRVTIGFGPRRDPRYQTEVPHNGLEITLGGAADPTTVRAIYPGKVLFAAHFEGYGPTVILHHAGRVFSLYAGLETLQVAEGDVLELGSSLGTATGRLYFEIRRNNRPEDPRDWLR